MMLFLFLQTFVMIRLPALRICDTRIALGCCCWIKEGADLWEPGTVQVKVPEIFQARDLAAQLCKGDLVKDQ